ncbi:MAG: membrane protein [Ardenticatenaceae bacterium]|nr:MAG: membrane protein [Ardenticatenaceae bacterium]
MWRKLLALMVLIGALLFSVPAVFGQDKSYSADRFDVDVIVQSDGSLLVTETVDFTFVGEPFTFVFRELPTGRTDGVEIMSASVDGRSYPQGSNAGQVEIDPGSDIRVTWHLEPTANTTRTFVLEYRMLGVVRQEEGVDLLRYQPLPDEFEYPIDSSTVTVTYPSVANLLETPTVTRGQAQVNRTGNVVTFSGQNIEANQTLIFDMNFAEGSLISAPPGWQAQRARENGLAPLWIGAGIFILTIGSLGAWLVYRNHQPTKYKSTAVIFEPPNDLPPAIVGVLNGHGAKPAWSNALATLFDLADRGILSIEEIDVKKWYQGQDFNIVQQKAAPSSLLPHELGLLDLLFDTKNGRETAVKMSKLSGMVTGKQWKKFTEPLAAELKAAGYIDSARKSRRQWVMGGSFIFLILGAIAMIGLPLGLVSQFGAWPIFIGISLFLTFTVWISTGSMLTILTDEAKKMADEWEAFHHYMKDVTSKKAAVGSTNMFFQLLPYAASYGLLHQWAKFFKKEGWTEVPPYFQAASRSGSDHMAAFVAMTGSSSSSGGAAAGAGGAGGAAGGGASGAG